MDGYYVYVYKENSEIVYVGMGQKGRAWHCGYMRGDTEERQAWKEEQIAKGKLPCDWVTIVERGLSKAEAKDLEVFMIAEIKPKLNRHHNPNYDHSRTPLDLKKIKQLRKAGLSYANIALKLGTSTMTVYRQFNKETA
jgi:hypothetical protein